MLVWTQKFAGATRPSSGTPLQSSSLPLHDSTVIGVTGQLYSQPFAGFLSMSAKPALQTSSAHLLAVHVATPLGSAHLLPHAPQLLTSVWRLKPSSTCPSQLSSRRLHTSSLGPCPIWQTFWP